MFTKLSSLMWITYCSYYFGRVNFSAIQPTLMAEQGWVKAQVGLISSALLAMYAVGQFTHGYLADRYGTRRIIIIGLTATALINGLMGLANSLIIMITLWGLNGFFQATGWPSAIKILGERYSIQKRGTIMGWWGTCYQAGTFMTWLLVSFVTIHWGWRYGFWVPSVIIASTMAIFAYAFRPRTGPVRAENNLPKSLKRSLGNSVQMVLSSSKIQMVSVAYACLGYLRYGFINWGILMLMERQQLGLSSSAVKMSMLPLAGAVGAVAAGWTSDSFFKSRRFPISTISFLAIILLLVPLLREGTVSGFWLIAIIGGIGLFINSADLILGGPTAQDLSPDGCMATTAGFIDGMMYVGAIFSGFLTGALIDRMGWTGALFSWIAAAAVGGGISIIIWIKEHEDA